MLTLPWLWANWRSHGNAHVMAIAPMMYLLPYLLSLRYTSPSERSGRTRSVIIAGLGTALIVFLLAVAWIDTKILGR